MARAGGQRKRKPSRQSHEARRIRDLCAIRDIVVSAAGGLVAGAVAQALSLAKLAELTAKYKVKDAIDAIDDILGRLGTELAAWLPPIDSVIPSPGTIYRFVVVQYPGVTIAVVTFLGVYAAVKLPVLKRIPARLFPDPPRFVDTRLEDTDAKADPVRWSYPGKPFVGREAELARLDAFAAAPGPFGLWSMHGQSGLGKSHLAAVWLKQLYRDGWDIGRLHQQASEADVEAWEPRADTAFVIDDVSRTDIPWPLIAATARKAEGSRRRVRVLLLSHVPQFVPQSDQVADLQRLHDGWLKTEAGDFAPSLELRPVDGAFVHAIRRAAKLPELPHTVANRIAEHTGGLVLYAALMALDPETDPRETIVRRANDALERARKVGGLDAQTILALGALVGPTAIEPRSWPIPAEPRWRAALFPQTAGDKAAMAGETVWLPSYEPQLEGDEVLLAFLADERTRLSDALVEAFVTKALAAGGERSIDRVLAILRDHDLWFDAVELRRDPTWVGEAGEYRTWDIRLERVQAIALLERVVATVGQDRIVERLGELLLHMNAISFDDVAQGHRQLRRDWAALVSWLDIGTDVLAISWAHAQCCDWVLVRWSELALLEPAGAARDEALASVKAALARLVELSRERWFPDGESADPVAWMAPQGALAATALFVRLAISERSGPTCDAAITGMAEALARLDELTDERFRDGEYARPTAELAARGAMGATVVWAEVAKSEAAGPTRDAAIAGMTAALARLAELSDERFRDGEYAGSIAEAAANGAANATLMWGALACGEPLGPARDTAVTGAAAALARLGQLSDDRFRDGEHAGAIGFVAAMGAANAAAMWAGLANREPSGPTCDAAIAGMTAALARLAELSDERFRDGEYAGSIAEAAAIGATNATQMWAGLVTNEPVREAAIAGMAAALARLAELSDERFRDGEHAGAIGVMAARGAANATLMWERLATKEPAGPAREAAIAGMAAALARLAELSDDRFPNGEHASAIGTAAVRGAHNATVMWCALATAGRTEPTRSAAFVGMRRSLARAVEMSTVRFCDSDEVASSAMLCSRNLMAMVNGLDLGALSDHERRHLASDVRKAFDLASVLIRNLRGSRSPHLFQLAETAAMVAADVIRHSTALRDDDIRHNAYSLLRDLRRDFPYVPKVAESAALFNVGLDLMPYPISLGPDR